MLYERVAACVVGLSLCLHDAFRNLKPPRPLFDNLELRIAARGDEADRRRGPACELVGPEQGPLSTCSLFQSEYYGQLH